MKILFVSQYYPPEIGAASNRIGYFARFLANAGHKVSVLTSAPNYPEGKLYPGYENRFLMRYENGVNVYRTKIFLTPKSNIATRLAHYLSFVVAAIFARKKIEKPDIIVATSPPLFIGLLGVIFKKLWKTPLLLDIRDLWPESVESVGAVKNRRLLKQGKALAKWIYKNANYVSCTSPGIEKNLTDVPKEKITILPNGAELDIFQPDISGEKTRRDFCLNNKFVVLYTGNLGLAQAPEVLVESARITLRQAQGDIIFLVVGSGVLLPKLEAEAKKKNLTNIIFTGVQPRNRMPEFVAAADVCIIPYKKCETFRFTLPSKMFDYMAGEKPIIINLKGEASYLIDKANCGLLAKEEDAQDLAEKILELYRDRGKAHHLGSSGRKFVEQHFRREVIAKRLLELLEKIHNRYP